MVRKMSGLRRVEHAYGGAVGPGAGRKSRSRERGKPPQYAQADHGA